MIRVNKVKRPNGTFFSPVGTTTPHFLKNIVEYNTISLRFLNQESTVTITTVKDIIYIFCRNQRPYTHTHARVNPTHARTHTYIRTHARKHAPTYDIHVMRIVERTSMSRAVAAERSVTCAPVLSGLFTRIIN